MASGAKSKRRTDLCQLVNAVMVAAHGVRGAREAMEAEGELTFWEDPGGELARARCWPFLACNLPSGMEIDGTAWEALVTAVVLRAKKAFALAPATRRTWPVAKRRRRRKPVAERKDGEWLEHVQVAAGRLGLTSRASLGGFVNELRALGLKFR